MINASIAGTTADASVSRLEGQVLSHRPDLVIVCFGLNDVNGPLEVYLGSLRAIFEGCLAAETDVIFMTPNMLNTRVADDTPREHYEYAFKTAEMQNGGRMDEFMSAARALAEEMGVSVCDCYAKWKKLHEGGVDITSLLSNYLNHPTRDMHWLFATSLVEAMFN